MSIALWFEAVPSVRLAMPDGKGGGRAVEDGVAFSIRAQVR